VAASDQQLKLHTATPLPNGSTILLHRLQFQRKAALYFTTLRDQLAITNDPHLLSDQGSEQQRAPILQAFVHNLSPQTLGRSLQLPPLTGQHAIALRADFLSFGYQHFFPALQGVRFLYDGKSWHTQILSRTPLPSPAQLWQRVPALPALCLALPVDTDRLLELLQPWHEDPQLPALLGALKAPAALCWYGDSALHTPLVVLPMTHYAPEWLPLLGKIFAQAVGSPVPLRDPKKATPALQPVQEESCPQGRIWRRTVHSAHGLSTANHPQRHLQATLALCHQTLIFTPDPLLADRALALLEQRYPTIAEQLRATPDAALLLHPLHLAELLKQSLLDSLPPESEKVFRSSVQQRLLPRLALLEGEAPLALRSPQQAHTWESVSWFRF
jgi:uncharacterized protein YfaA (DUF2138 family)